MIHRPMKPTLAMLILCTVALWAWSWNAWGDDPTAGAAGVTGAAQTTDSWWVRIFSSDYMPRISCMNHEADVIWTHVISDTVIAAAYYSIPIALLYLLRKRSDLVFGPIFYCFALFILLCGTTHVFSILAIWHPMYRLDGLVKAATALVSIITAVVLWPLIPKAMALPSPALLRQAQQRLHDEEAQRVQAQREITQLNQSLEARVQARTAELEAANKSLEASMRERRQAEEGARKSEAQLHTIVENLGEGVVVSDLDGRVTHFNRAALSMHGFQSVEDIQLQLKDFATIFELAELHGPALPIERWPLGRVLAGETLRNLEVRLRRPATGWVRVFNYGGSLVHDAAGKPLMAVVTMTDITERKRTEDAQAHLAAIVASSDDAIISKTLDGIMTSWNRGAEKLFGYTAEEAVGKPMLMLFPPDRIPEEEEILQRIRRGEGVDHVETVRIAKDGRRVDISATISPIRDVMGRVVAASKIARDISQRKAAEQELKAQLERLDLLNHITRAIGERQDLQSILQVVIRSLEEKLPVDFSCVCVYDAPEHLLKVVHVGINSSATASELSMAEQASIPIDENGLSRCVQGHLVYEPDISLMPYPFPRRLLRGGLRSLVMTPLLVESKVFGVLIAGRRAADGFVNGECEFLKQLSGHLALAWHQSQLYTALQEAYDDLRRTQQAVMQQERLRALGQMASGIAHDINNAITPLSFFTELLLEQEPAISVRGRDHLETMKRAIDDVGHTVARLSEFYRQREPQLPLTRVDLNQLIPQVVNLSRARWSDMPLQRGVVIHLHTDLLHGLPEIMGVENEIREALINLIFNSVDAMPKGGELHLRTRRLAQWPGGERTVPPEGLVQVELSDTGVGMDQETLRHCFEPFYTTKGERGTGLGLAMVYGIIKRHNSDIQLDSAPGKGTTVRLTFSAASAPTHAPAAAPRKPPIPAHLRILVVDDDPLLAKALRYFLETDGHIVTVAHDGKLGIEAFLAAHHTPQPFDVIITDLGMPHVDGRQVAGAVKTASPTTPVILLTGWGQRLVAEGDIPMHVDRVLNKPPKLQELRAALADVTAQS